MAVSGGGDSVALLHILSRCFEPGAVEVAAVTVDHGLRPQSAREAEEVGELAERLEIAHTTLRWTGWDGTGNLQARARDARYRLIGEWAKTLEISVVAFGHTADDQAETVLMGLARSSGVNGLSAMPVRRTLHGINLLRPLLGATRQELRDYLRGHDIAWSEDPSNEDDRFDRVKVREALKLLAPIGLTAQVLSDVAGNMAQAREALDWFGFLSARDLAVVDGGDVSMDLRRFRTLPAEIARRLLTRAILWVGGQDQVLRRVPVSQALDAARQGRAITLGGCHVLSHGNRIWVCREFNAVRHERSGPQEIWDRRWRLDGPCEAGVEIRPLGRKGVSDCPDWRLTGRPLSSVIASPAIWKDDELLAAPLAGRPEGWKVRLTGGEEEFFASLLSH
ncbi:tRNA lysidine(34) synthetase TilS [Sedimentitalea xiamensis]|uniref:tRNA lysidine(34) synthetase TilS n=1 Tax=Sedimentitalea xiamensis TaxID=3050037 RepID=UPI0038999CEE